MAKNPFAKTVKVTNSYEIWLSEDGWIYHVLKKWQTDDNKPFGRWFCHVYSNMTSERGDMGDAYVTSVKHGNRQVVNNPNAYTIKFHVHAEQSMYTSLSTGVEIRHDSLKTALYLYERHTAEYGYVQLSAELYKDGETVPVEVQMIHTFGTKVVQIPEQAEAQKCDVCLTWVATHDVIVAKEVYHVCDKPGCQDKVAALADTDNRTGG